MLTRYNDSISAGYNKSVLAGDFYIRVGLYYHDVLILVYDDNKLKPWVAEFKPYNGEYILSVVNNKGEVCGVDEIE